jgi:hypothetical protein
MNPMFRCPLIYLVLAWPPSQDVPVDEILATVNGVAITRSDVEWSVLEGSTPRTEGEVLRQLVYQKILFQKARDANLSIPDASLSATMSERVEAAGGWDRYQERLKRKGSTSDEDRQEVRNALLADEYVNRCLGRVPGSPLLRPHLARTIRVTPLEVQTYFRENRETFRTSDTMEIGRLLVVKAHFAAEAEARKHAELLRRQALEIYQGNLREVIREGDQARYGTMTLSGPDQPKLLEEVRAYLRTAPVKVLSPVIETQTAFVVVVKLSEEHGRMLPFGEVQDAIFAVLSELKFREARKQLSRELLSEVDIWPKILFGSGLPAGTDVAPPPDRP